MTNENKTTKTFIDKLRSFIKSDVDLKETINIDNQNVFKKLLMFLAHGMEKKMKFKRENRFWFMDEIRKPEHIARIGEVFKIREYLLRKHDILNRHDIEFKEGTFSTSKMLFNTIKSIVEAHASYVIGRQVSISGEPDIVSDFNRIYRKGRYPKVDYELAADLYKYGNAFEYVYLDGDTIRSHVIANEDAYPVYDEHYNYTHFIEHWKDNETYTDHYVVYYPDKVETYHNHDLIETKANLTGLPIHYISLDKTDIFGDGLVADLIPIMDSIEYLMSMLDDAAICLSLNPIGVVQGKRIDSKIPKDVVGAILNLEDKSESDFKWAASTLDSDSVKLLLDNLIQQFYAVACIPASMYGQSNISNVSEVSLKYLFSQTDNKARKTIQSLMDGMFLRFEYFRKLQKLRSVRKEYSDEEFDSLNINFNLSRPVDTNSLMSDLKMQQEMGAISKQTVIEKSPYTNDVSLELDRIEKENAAGKPLEE